MLYYKFKNHEEFKELFGIVKHGNGNESRKNKILLHFLKDRRLLHEAAVSGNYLLLHISDMATMKNLVTEKIIRSGDENRSLPYVIDLMGKRYYSSTYSTDDNKGLCEDGDTKAVRYINMENGERVFKMKAGKFYRHLIQETDFGRKLPQQVVTFLCEEFAGEWQSYTMGQLPKNKLHVDKDFKRIYSSKCCKGNFGSCMVDRDHHYFYLNAVNASAAYLEDEEGKVISRCVIFNEVKDEEGKVWRLAERQYASEENEILKRALVEALIDGNYIDGYKKTGAGCGDARAFVDIHGNSLAGKRFRIDCDLDLEDTLSYQDSFNGMIWVTGRRTTTGMVNTDWIPPTAPWRKIYATTITTIILAGTLPGSLWKEGNIIVIPTTWMILSGWNGKTSTITGTMYRNARNAGNIMLPHGDNTRISLRKPIVTMSAAVMQSPVTSRRTGIILITTRNTMSLKMTSLLI